MGAWNSANSGRQNHGRGWPIHCKEGRTEDRAHKGMSRRYPKKQSEEEILEPLGYPFSLSSLPPPSSKLINHEASEESIGDYFSDLGIGKGLLSGTQNVPINHKSKD